MFTSATEQTALLVIDMQTFFEGMVSPAMKKNIYSLVQYFRSLKVPNRAQRPHELGLVVFTQHGHSSEELDVPSADKSPSQLVRKWGIDGSIREGTKDWQFMEEILSLIDDPEEAYLQGKMQGKAKLEQDLRRNGYDDSQAINARTAIIPKNTYDAFINTQLEELLRGRGIKRVVVCGVMTDCCCDTTARSAFNRGFKTWLVKDACASANETQHKRGLEAFGYAFGEVLSTREVLGRLDIMEEDPTEDF